MISNKNSTAERSPRIVAEQKIVNQMIRIYCKNSHKHLTLCDDCSTLSKIAQQKLAECKFAKNKPTCRRCAIPCWNGKEKEQIQTVMRFAGPRMLFYSPITALIHLMHEYRAVRYLGIVLGWISLVLGVIGIVVPGLPTTPFVLLSAFLFAQTSPPFHQWLRNNHLFGKIIRTWESERAIPKGMKSKALILFGVTIGISIVVIPMFHAKIALGLLALAVGIFLLRLPEQKQG